LQHEVADVVAISVVDLLEAIEVDVDQAKDAGAVRSRIWMCRSRTILIGRFQSIDESRFKGKPPAGNELDSACNLRIMIPRGDRESSK
jgi:hypothetical protein